jgi:replicative DNA helicase
VTEPLDKREQLLNRTKEIERTVLGAILVDNDRYLDALERINERDFFSPAHQIVFRAIARRLDVGQPIDLALLMQDLGTEELDNVGGAAWLSRLIDGVPRAMNVGAYAEEVAKKSTLRALAKTAAKIFDASTQSDDDADEILEQAEREIFAIRERNTRAEVLSDDARGRATMTLVNDIISSGGGMRGLPTGLTALDADMRGLQKGDFILVAARPSMGKTSLLQHFAMAAGRVDPVLLFSLEMSNEQLNIREVTTRASVNSWRLMHGKTNEWEQRRLATALEELRQGGVHTVDNASVTLGQLRAIARRFKAQHGLSMLGLDYIQLMMPERTKGDRGSENRTIELGIISRGLKQLARELNVPTVVLSQLSRGPESRPDKRPQLSDLRESGALEQDADVVMLCFRPNAYKDIRDKDVYKDHYYEINLAKQRNGPTGIIQVAFYRETTRFADYTEEPEAMPVRRLHDDLPLEAES